MQLQMGIQMCNYCMDVCVRPSRIFLLELVYRIVENPVCQRVILVTSCLLNCFDNTDYFVKTNRSKTSLFILNNANAVL